MSLRSIKSLHTQADNDSSQGEEKSALREAGSCLLVLAVMGAPVYLPFVVGKALGWVTDAFGLDPLVIIFIVALSSIVIGGMIGCIFYVLLQALWLDSFLEKAVLEPYHDKIRNAVGGVFIIISSLLVLCCVSGGLIRSEWSKIGHSAEQEECYWVSKSSGKTHNASCRYYANSKGYYSSTGTGNNCNVCGGAGL